MVKQTTVTLIQSIFAMFAVVLNASTQSYALAQLKRAAVSNADTATAEKYLLISIIMQYVAAVLSITASVLLIIYKKELQAHMNKFLYLALIVSGLLLLGGGSIGAAVATRLQCYRSDPNIQKAWEMSAISATVGIAGTMAMLLIQAFIRRDVLKDVARDYLTHQTIRQPTHIPVAKAKKAVMPAHHPVPYKYDY